MKKIIAMLLALVMVMSMTACGGNETNETEGATEATVANLEGTMEENVNKIIELNPVEFMGGIMPVDITDTSEDGLANLYYFTGLETAEQISDLAVYEPMIGSIAFSMVMVRANEGADIQAVAETMKNGINTRKWVCVEADDMMVASFGDVALLIMVSSGSGLTAQSFVDAFATVCGGEVTTY